MILPLYKYKSAVLRKKGAKADPEDPKIKKLVSDMLETMHAAQGIGLAAQQVGQALQVAVIDVTGVEDRPSKMWIKGEPVDLEAHMPLILINPEIKGTKNKETATEGCLSFPGISAEISRSARVKVKAKTLEGKALEFEASGLLAKAVQHEHDHLHGKLFIDLMDAETKKELQPDLEALAAEPNESFIPSPAPKASKKTRD